jgi:hypothetical protein
MTFDELKRVSGIESLRDPWFRLTSGLYKIVDKSGQVIPFIPNDAQRRLLTQLLRGGVKRSLIVKARQLGFSTLIALYIFDMCYFTPNQQASIIDLTQSDAQKKLLKCRFAYENLFSELKSPLVKANESELVFANGSILSASISARGGTNQFLHVSEFGPMAYEDPKRAGRVITGAFPSVPDDGVIIIETTYMGGKAGLLYDMIETARRVDSAQKTAKDWHLVFESWLNDDGYSMQGDMGRVTRETHALLDGVGAKLRRYITPGQRLWYQVTREQLREKMFSEYPSVLEECYNSIVKGAIYADIIASLRESGRIFDFVYDRRFPVCSSWDVGYGDSCCVWYWQLRGNTFDVLGCDVRERVSASQMAQIVRDKEFAVTAHYLPHDAGQHGKNDGKTYMDALRMAGLRNLHLVPRIPDKWLGINQLRDVLPRCQFSEKACEKGLDALMAYHAKEEFNGAVLMSVPVHDWASHPSDALRTMGEAYACGMIKDTLDAGAKPVRGGGIVQAWEGYKP